MFAAHLHDFADISGVQVVARIILLQQRGVREAFGGHVLMVQLFAEEDELCLLVIGNTVAEGGGQLAGLGLVAVPPAVAAAVIERGAVAFIKKAK